MKKITWIIICFFLAGGYIFWYAIESNTTSQNNKNKVNSTASIQKTLDYRTNLIKSMHMNEKEYTSLSFDAKQKLLENSIIQAYADSHGISVSDNEVQTAYLKRVLSEYKSEDEFLANLLSKYGMDKQTYLTNLKQELLKEKVAKSLSEPIAQWLASQKGTVTP